SRSIRRPWILTTWRCCRTWCWQPSVTRWPGPTRSTSPRSAGSAASADCSPDAPRVYASPVQDLIDELGRLPGIGPKSAQRIAFHLLKLSKDDALRLARSISEVKDRIVFCSRCFNIAERSEVAGGHGGGVCAIC